jgi:Ni/Co efflux regulator RcnB
MRKFILLGLMAAVVLPVTVQAQSRSEIRRDREDVREQRDDLRDARQRGDRRDAREERGELKEARRELREDLQDRRRSQYVAPYRGWHYNAVRTGQRLRPAFYGSRYHIANPAHYRVRPAARNQRWIRYGNDLLLVNTRTGRVLQVAANRY